MNVVKRILFLVFIGVFFSCKTEVKVKVEEGKSSEVLKGEIDATLTNWHKAAAEANFEAYFNLMTKDGVFIGTDATENWQNEDFRAFSKPYFDKGKAWSFTALERNVYLSEDKNLAWFDELLDTQMKLCRGSGIMKLENNEWKIAHYVLSITIPNENVNEVIEIKKEFDNELARTLLNKG